jgi:[ribosomal protein S5]-alanine N-acetyltransferase
MPTLTQPVVAARLLRALSQPTLDSNGLLVRPWQAEDAPAVFEAYQDPEIQRWHVRSMIDLSEAEAWIGSWPDRWREETGADWAVMADGVVTGRVGIKSFDLWEGIAELSYWVLPAARGRNIAARAVTSVSGWAFDALGLHRLELKHASANHASCRAATKAGFRPEGTLRRQGLHVNGWHDMHLHARVNH